MSQAGSLDATSNDPQIPTQFETDNGTSVPIANTLDIVGNTVDNATGVKPLYTEGVANQVAINVQVGAAISGAPADKNDAGLVSFDDTDFAVDSNGFVTFLGGGGTVFGLLSDEGLPAVDPDGNGDIGLLGGVGINTTGQDPLTAVTVNLDVPVEVANGGTGAITLTDGGILLGSGTNPVTATAQPTDGQLLIGSTGGDPVLNTLTEGNGIDILNAAGSITLSVDQAELDDVVREITTDEGAPAVVPTAGNVNILGGEGIDVTGQGPGSTVTVSGELATAAANVGASNLGISSYLNDDFSVTSGFTELADTVVKSVVSDSGTVTPSGHSFTATGTGGITTSGSGSTLTIDGSGLSPSLTITGNTGGALSPTAGNWNIVTDNATVTFAGAASTLTQDFNLTNLVLGSSLPALTVGSANVAMGADALKDVTSGAQNVAIGHNAAQVLTTGSNNVGVGKNALVLMTDSVQNVALGHSTLANMTTSVGSNTAVGYAALFPVTTGTANIGLGSNSASNFTGTESSNIIIGSGGVAADNNTIRIGTQGNGVGQQDTTFVAGITGTTVAGSVVNVASTGQLGDLGFGTSGQVLTSNGAGVSPTWQAGGGGGGVAGPTNISNGLGTWNLGMSYSAGTVTIHGADGNALSGSNIGYVTLRSNVNPGQLVTYPLTSNYTFQDSVGTSVFAGSLFGFDTGDTTSIAQAIAGTETVPFFLYAVADDNDANLIFACSRVPTFTISDTSRFFNAGSGSADEAYDLLTLQSVTIGNYDDNEAFLVGSFEMNKTAGDDWTVVTVVNQRVGFGKYARGRYAHFRGTNGAASNSFFLNNGGTAPTITSGQASYTINIWDGTATYNFSWNFSGSPSGAVSAICTTPIRGGTGGPGMFYATVWRFMGAPSLDHSIAMLERNTLGDLIQATVYKNDGTPATWQLNEFPSSDGAISGVMTIPL